MAINTENPFIKEKHRLMLLYEQKKKDMYCSAKGQQTISSIDEIAEKIQELDQKARQYTRQLQTKAT